MKRQMKKLISMILAMAMVVTSINFTPRNVSAEDDGSGWTTISGMKYQGNNNTDMTLNYKVAKGAEGSAIYSYGNYYLKISPSGLTSSSAAKVYLNEGQTTEGTTELTVGNASIHDGTAYNIGLGLSGVNLQPNKYYSLRFVYDENDVVYYFYTGNKEDIKEETTTETTTIELQALSDVELTYSDDDGEYKVGFSDPNKVTVEDGATYTYTLNINGQKIENIKSSDSIVDLSNLNLTEGTEYSVTMNAVYKKGATTVTSPDSAKTTFTYRKKQTATIAVPTNLSHDESVTEAYKVIWDSVEGAVSYNVYFDDEVIGNTKSALYKIDIAKMMDGKDHKIAVSAMEENGAETEKSSSLDAKIELNWQTNETLTAQCGEGA